MSPLGQARVPESLSPRPWPLGRGRARRAAASAQAEAGRLTVLQSSVARIPRERHGLRTKGTKLP